jgi:iron complex outermembrane receptor protein
VRYKLALRASAAALALLPITALAQTAQPSSPETGPAFQVDEIIVTARKQAERLADIPLAITAFDAEQIENAGIKDLNDIARLTPGLNFTSVIGEFLPTPIIRGVAQTDLFGSDPNVAVFIDGVYTGAREALNFAQADIERVEVVKGPQSALYGRNAFGGAINIISKRPSHDRSGRAEMTYGSNGRFAVLGSASLPIIEDVLAVKLTGSHSKYDGSHRNTAGGPDLGGYTYRTFQGTARFTPNANTDIVGGLYYSRDKITPPAVSGLTPNCEPARGVNQAWCGVLPELDTAELSSHPDAYGQTRETMRAFVDARVDLGEWQLSWLTGYNDVELSALTDATRGIPTFYRYRTATGAIKTFETGILRDEGKPTFQEFSQEIRLTSPQEARVRGSIGAYYFSGKQTRPNFDGVITTPLPADFVATFPVPGVWASFFDGVIYDKTVQRDVTNLSAFGYLEGELTSHLTLRGELRYGYERQHTTRPASKIGQPVAAVDKELSFRTWTPRISLDYQPNRNVLLYTSAARGSKPGGFDLSAPTEQYDPEYNWTYEVGAKTNTWGGRIGVDFNAFYIDWTQIQIPVLDQTQAPPVAVTRNLGDATSKGFEANLNLRPMQGLSAILGVSYTDARYTNAKNAGYAQFPSFAPDGDVSGNRLQAAPKWQLTSSVDYRRAAMGNFEGFVHLDASYRAKSFMDATNLTIIPSRTLVNGRIGLENERFRVEAFVENLLDDRKPTFAFRDVFLSNFVNNAAAIFPPRVTVSHPRGREFGVRTSLRF